MGGPWILDDQAHVAGMETVTIAGAGTAKTLDAPSGVQREVL
jgi:hypothetical protein